MTRSDEGFTLAEMLVVLGVLALTAALALPVTRQSAAGQEFVSFSRALAGLLREARLQAISQNRDTAVTLDFTRHLASAAAPGRELVIPDTLTVTAVTARGDVARSTATFRFFADGGATGGTIRLKAGLQQRAIAISWLTGSIVISDGAKP